MTDVKAITNQRRALTADDISLLEAFIRRGPVRADVSVTHAYDYRWQNDETHTA